MTKATAEIVREYGPFPGVERVNGVTFDGAYIWFASGDKLHALDPATGELLRSIDVAAHAGTAFDGRYLYQIGEDRIQKIDPESGREIATIPAPVTAEDSGLTWAEGALWVGEYRARQDSPDRSRDGQDSADDRVEAIRHGSDVGRRESSGLRRLGRRRGRARRVDPGREELDA
jgi:hypothetical protein